MWVPDLDAGSFPFVTGTFVVVHSLRARDPRAGFAHSGLHAAPGQDPAIEGKPEDKDPDEKPDFFHDRSLRLSFRDLRGLRHDADERLLDFPGDFSEARFLE